MFNESFWVAIAFVILAMIIYTPVRKRIIAILEARITKIEDELEKIGRIKKEAADILKEYKERQRRIVEETQRIIDNAEAEVIRMTERAERDVQKYTEEKNRLMMSKIESLESDAIKSLRIKAVAEAMKMIDQIINNKLDRKEAEILLTQSITEVTTSIKH